jgi:hypothetical protein
MRAVIVPLLLLALACGQAQPERAGEDTGAPPAPQVAPPTTDEAQDIVANSPEFSEYQFTHAAYSLPMDASLRTAPAQDIAGKLAKAGWIGTDGADRIVLTAKAEKDKRFLVRPNGVLDIVPLAKKEFEAVESVGTNAEGQPVVAFRWRWNPNDIGALFAPRYSGQQHATATLYRDGDSWAVLRIVPRGTT